MHQHNTNATAPLSLGKTYATPINSLPAKETLPRFILKGCAYAVYGLMVVVDGLNNPESFQSRFLTLPYLIGGLALVRSFCDALEGHYDLHAFVFALGISTLGALA